MLIMVLMFCAFVMMLKGVRPPHPIFLSGEPPLLDAEIEEEDEEGGDDLEARKSRASKRGGIDTTTQKFSGKGIDFTAREKQLLSIILNNCTKFWKIDNCDGVLTDSRRSKPRQHYKFRPDKVWDFVSEITGVSTSALGRINQQVNADNDKNGPEGFVMPSNRTGVQRDGVNATALEAILPEMDEFIRDEIIKARKAGHLTVKILAEKATAYFAPCGQIKPKRMKRTLNRLGYQYGDRKGVFMNRRHDPENLKRLKDFCEWVYENVVYNATTGRYFFTIPVAFGDGANEYTKAFRPRSWMLCKDPVLGTCEKPRKKEQGQRVNMLGAIYSNSFDMDSMTAWNSEDKDRNSYAKSDDIVKHTRDHVLPNLPSGTGAVYVLDNASNNKKLEDDVHIMTSAQLQDWINDHDLDQTRFQTYWANESEKHTGETAEKKMLMKYIRQNIDEFTELATILRARDVKLRYLPKYYPECNPIELVWAHIKRSYKATDPKLPWRARLDLAHGLVTEEQIDKCFDRSIRYCLDRLQELQEKEDVHGGEEETMDIVDDADEEDWMNEDDDY